MFKTIVDLSTNPVDASLPLERDGFNAAKTNYRCTLDINSLAGTADITSVTIDGTAVAIPAGTDIQDEGFVQQVLVTAANTLDYIQCGIQVTFTAAAGSDPSNFLLIFTGEANVTSVTIGGTPRALTVTTLAAQ
jgi:hypothetical protein